MRPDRRKGVWLPLLVTAALAGLLVGGTARAILPPPSFGRGPAQVVPPTPPIFIMPTPPPTLPEIGILPGKPIYSLPGGSRPDIGNGYFPRPPEVATSEPGSLALMGVGILTLALYACLRPRKPTPPQAPGDGDA